MAARWAVLAIIAMALYSVSMAAVMKPHRDDRELAGVAVPVGTDTDLQVVLSALLSLYSATGGPHWANNAGWSSVPPVDPCTTGTSTWYGITCNGASVW
jgi:hypothetical protein